MSSSQQKITFMCLKTLRDFFVGSKCKFKVKLQLIDLPVPVKPVSHNASQQAFLLKLFKSHCQFLGFVIYDKNISTDPLKVRAKLCTQIHELLWLRAAELQRKKITTEWKRKVPNLIKEVSEEAWKDLFSSESEQLFRQVTRDPTAFKTQENFILTLLWGHFTFDNYQYFQAWEQGDISGTEPLKPVKCISTSGEQCFCNTCPSSDPKPLQLLTCTCNSNSLITL